MSTLVTINGSDLPTNSRADINGNFAALNSEKLETSVLDTDTTLAANSNSKVPTQAAVKAYVDAGGNVNASTTGKGIVEEATQAEVDAGTATGGTGARLFVSPSTLTKVATTVVPFPVAFSNSATTATINDAVTAVVGMVNVPAKIVVNKVSFRVSSYTSSDTLDISLYSEDGQTRIFSVTSASVTAATSVFSATVPAVVVPQGNYYLLVNGNATPNFSVHTYQNADPFGATGSLNNVSSYPVLTGTLSITSGTPPATITPASITAAISKTVMVRFDT